MGFVCKKCGKRYPLLKKGQKKWGEPEKCNAVVREELVEDYVACDESEADYFYREQPFKMVKTLKKCEPHKCGGNRFEEDTNSNEELQLMSQLYYKYFKIPTDISMYVFTNICNKYSWPTCGSGHPAGQCIHNKECIESYMRKHGWLL